MLLLRIDPMVSGGKEILPAFYIEREVSRYNSAVLHLYREAPTMAQLRHAYETNGEIRDGVSEALNGEWTSTLLRDGKEIVERPGGIIYKNDFWVANDGVVKKFDHFPDGMLPGKGWILSYDGLTGMPDKTGRFEEAREIFGDHASKFWPESTYDGLRCAWRYSSRSHGISSPFNIAVGWRPDTVRRDLGFRYVHD